MDKFVNNGSDKVLFAGKILKVANCGESMKNHVFLKRLRELYSDVIAIEISAPKHKPYRILNFLFKSIMHPKIPLIISCSSREAYFYIRLLNIINRKNVYYWVIGGALHRRIEEGKYKAHVYSSLNKIFVESTKMVSSMQNSGLNNVFYCPNFKDVNYLPNIDRKNSKTEFVFLSRIHPDKGCSMILETIRELNKIVDKNSYNVTFYGPIADGYSEEFNDLLSQSSNAFYKGFLDLTKKEGYDVLSTYDVMLFPTWWRGEGFPGIIIDAYIAGLPIVASDWNFNTELIDEHTGWIIPNHDINALYNCMLNILKSRDYKHMSKACQEKALLYDVHNVIKKID